ncbi:MAG TPA: endonuclease/exonuclease/phosphatase family protein [Candidatus Limnocylindrales bacterium]|nr:endonuclease/exonuclease/phosphatase family protein [Candidatus Limnocylindrales bacterium]
MDRHLLRTTTARLGATIVGATALVEWLLAIARPEGGPLGVLQILAPHLAILGLVLAPVALLGRSRSAVVAAVALAAVIAIRFSGDWMSLPAAAPPAGTDRIAVATWNLEVESRPGVDTATFLRTVTADVIGLQELQPAAAAAIEADPVLRAAFPYRYLQPRTDVLGLGILSRVPILEPSVRLGPAIQEATLDLGGGRRIGVVNAHPFHADIASLGSTRIPVGLDVDQRNADLDTIRARIDARAAGGDPVLLIGDLNTAASEPAFDRFVRGLRDVHAEVGEGTGWTWRPIRLEFLGLGLVRIDHIVVTPGIVPLTTGGTCPPIGDHCLVLAELAIPAGAFG